MSAAISGCGSPRLHGGLRPCPSSGAGPREADSNNASPGWLVMKPRVSTRLIYVNMVDMDTFRDEPLGYLLHRVTAALRAEVTATVLEPSELTAPEYLCLRMLAASPKSNAQLAREAQVSPQAMNKVVRELLDCGFVLCF